MRQNFNTNSSSTDSSSDNNSSEEAAVAAEEGELLMELLGEKKKEQPPISASPREPAEQLVVVAGNKKPSSQSQLQSQSKKGDLPQQTPAKQRVVQQVVEGAAAQSKRKATGASATPRKARVRAGEKRAKLQQQQQKQQQQQEVKIPSGVKMEQDCSEQSRLAPLEVEISATSSPTSNDDSPTSGGSVESTSCSGGGGGGGSSSGSGAQENICAACMKPIKERYLLMALDKQWHEDCLKCACCDCRLGEVGSSLFTHSDKILCRIDFLRIFGPHGRCAACKKSIPPYEMVMRANQNAYHMDCFACQQCHYRFCVGDRFHLTETHRIVCMLCHNEQQQQQPPSQSQPQHLQHQHQPFPHLRGVPPAGTGSEQSPDLALYSNQVVQFSENSPPPQEPPEIVARFADQSKTQQQPQQQQQQHTIKQQACAMLTS